MRDLSLAAWRSYFTGNDAVSFKRGKKAVLSLLPADKKAAQEKFKVWVKPLALAAFGTVGVATIYCGRNYFSTLSVSPILTDPLTPTDSSLNSTAENVPPQDTSTPTVPSLSSYFTFGSPSPTSQSSQPAHSTGDPVLQPTDAPLVPKAFQEEMGQYLGSTLEAGSQVAMQYPVQVALLGVAAAISTLICGYRCYCKKQPSTEERICQRVCPTNVSAEGDGFRALVSDDEDKSPDPGRFSIIFETTPEAIVEQPELKQLGSHLFAFMKEPVCTSEKIDEYAEKCFGSKEKRSFVADERSVDPSILILESFHQACRFATSHGQDECVEENLEMLFLLCNDDPSHPIKKNLIHILQWTQSILTKVKKKLAEEDQALLGTEQSVSNSAEIRDVLETTMPEEIEQNPNLKKLLLTLGQGTKVSDSEIVRCGYMYFKNFQTNDAQLKQGILALHLFSLGCSFINDGTPDEILKWQESAQSIKHQHLDMDNPIKQEIIPIYRWMHAIGVEIMGRRGNKGSRELEPVGISQSLVSTLPQRN
jgi:hypothetical protein